MLGGHVAEDAVEARWLDDPPDPAAAFAEGDRLLAKWTAALEGLEERDVRPWYVRQYWRRRTG